MDIEIKISSLLSDKDKAVVKAFGHLVEAKRKAFQADGYLRDDFKEYFEDEISAIHGAAVALKFVMAGLALQVMDIALANGAGHEDYARFVDDEGGTIAFVYVQ